MTTETDIFNRVRLLTGDEAFQAVSSARVIIFGVGGVGSWCAESLVRTGIGEITLVDADCVAPTNINRQLMALHSTVGQSKVEVLAKRLRDINPAVRINAIHSRYTAESAADFNLASYNYIIDAIDSLADKASLIIEATSLPRRCRFFSSMGAALRLDPGRIETAEFWKVEGDPLAAALRRHFRKSGIMPRRKFTCVYSRELLRNRAVTAASTPTADGMSYGKVAVNGAVAHITAIFGFTLAGLVVNDILTAANRG